MFLEKWYADVVSGEELTVLYRARLGFGPFHWGYQGEIRHDASRLGTFSYGMPRDSLPDMDAAGLHFRTGAQETIWQAPCLRPFTLWSHGRHSVVWNPVVLNSPVVGQPSGRGYAERLSMNVMPWKLKMSRLWWGRFCGARHSLVWIVWEGEIALRLALMDGAEADFPEVTDRYVRVGDLYLDMADTALLVEAPLGTGALARMPWPKKLAPMHFLQGVERKWFGRAYLSRAGKVLDRGSVVYERVDWP